MNRERERNTYGKMFFRKGLKKKPSEAGSASAAENAPSGEEESKEETKDFESVQDYLNKKFPKQTSNFKTVEDKEFELEVEKIDKEVDDLV